MRCRQAPHHTSVPTHRQAVSQRTRNTAPAHGQHCIASLYARCIASLDSIEPKLGAGGPIGARAESPPSGDTTGSPTLPHKHVWPTRLRPQPQRRHGAAACGGAVGGTAGPDAASQMMSRRLSMGIVSKATPFASAFAPAVASTHRGVMRQGGVRRRAQVQRQRT
jgi:hypothetical protein